ncbi:four helix bundle protein [candidate division KSB1 bacterium]|nr:MAG: four helix bundle protein [candidate division KSB1 bacterium]
MEGHATRGNVSALHAHDLRERTRAYALRIIRLYQALPKTGASPIIGKQILRAGTSVGAHVAEASRAKSRADFTNKIDGAMQELEETLYWLDLLAGSGIVKPVKLKALADESSELMAIFVSMVKKTRSV